MGRLGHFSSSTIATARDERSQHASRPKCLASFCKISFLDRSDKDISGQLLFGGKVSIIIGTTQKYGSFYFIILFYFIFYFILDVSFFKNEYELVQLPEDRCLEGFKLILNAPESSKYIKLPFIPVN